MRFPEIGEVFAENYRIEKMLGSGGFSRVYMATQLDLDRAVAIKILQPPLQGTQNERERDEKLQGLINRFEREARMVSKLKSPHTITMYAYGQDDEGQLFMSIEYVDGRTLSELIREEGALHPDRVAKIMRQVLVSLYEAHELGMLHRDIKPQNIMAYEHLGQTDQVKLLDFGIVKLIGSESTRDQVDLTSDDTLVGTPRYMAPEYIRGENLTASSDLYSLGLVMYELLVGERAIQADSSIQIIGKQLERESFYLPAHIGEIDIALRSIINGMLEKNTKLRYQSASDILADLNARDQNKYIAPPNAPTLQNVPTHKVDLTERLSEAITERRKSDGPPVGPPPLQLPSAGPPARLPEVKVEPLTLIEPDIEEPTASSGKNRLAILLVLLLFIVGSIGTVVALTSGPDKAEPVIEDTDTTTAHVAVTKTEPASPETSSDELAKPEKVEEPTRDTASQPPVDTEPVQPEEQDIKTPPEQDLPKPEPRTTKSKTRPVRKKTTSRTAQPKEEKKATIILPTKTKKDPPKKTAPKTDPYKIIVPE